MFRIMDDTYCCILKYRDVPCVDCLFLCVHSCSAEWTREYDSESNSSELCMVHALWWLYPNTDEICTVYYVQVFTCEISDLLYHKEDFNMDFC